MAMDALGEVSADVNKILGREMTKAIASDGVLGFVEEEFGPGMPAEFSRWLLRNVEKLDEDREVAVYLGGRVKDGEKRADVVKRVSAQLTKVADEAAILEEASWTSGPVSWTGFEISIAEIEDFIETEAPEGITERRVA